jgi:hypothetical protein
MKTKLLNHILILFVGTLFGSCDINDTKNNVSLECGVINPLEDLSWLNQKLENIKEDPLSGIILYRYNSRQVIEVQSSLMSSTNISQYYCDGTKLNFEDPVVYQDFLKNRVEIKILYGIDLWKL